MEVLVTAYNRPRYLYVTLDSLYRAREIKKYRIHVYVDGGLNEDTRQQQVEVLEQFPLTSVVWRRANLGTLQNITSSLNELFLLGADEVLYLEDDYIVSPVVFKYLQTVSRECFFISLSTSRNENRKRYCYLPYGNLVSRSNFVMLFRYVTEKLYKGIKHKRSDGTTEVLDDNCVRHDIVYDHFLLHNNLLTYYAERPYASHIGVTGIHFVERPKLRVKMENRFFSGPREGWLDNIVKILEEKSYISFFNQVFVPKNFQYR